jgi:hypothetical protein
MIIKAFNYTDARAALKLLPDKSKIQLNVGSERILFGGVCVIDAVAMLIIKTPDYKSFITVDRHRCYDNTANQDQLRFMYESGMASRIYIGLADEWCRLDVEVSCGAAMRNEYMSTVTATKARSCEPYFCVNTQRWM